MTNKISQRGGVNIGSDFVLSRYSSWPSAHLTATKTEIILRAWGKGYYFFDKSHISAIRPYNGLFGIFSRGVQVLHTKEDYPQFVVFWNFWGPSRTKLVYKLQELGYPIDESIGKMWE